MPVSLLSPTRPISLLRAFAGGRRGETCVLIDRSVVRHSGRAEVSVLAWQGVPHKARFSAAGSTAAGGDRENARFSAFHPGRAGPVVFDRSAVRRRARACKNRLVRRFLPVAALLVLAAGCAGAPASTPSGSGSPLVTPASATASGSPTLASPSTAPTPGVTTITIELADGKASPNGSRVNLTKGETFVLDITSDRNDEVHVHGFDKEIEVAAGKHVTVEMVADRTGRFEVESHHPELLIAVLQIR